eukprot:COSAG01_NODE_7908_length_2997_cov_10.717046_1_plen_181_part_00
MRANFPYFSPKHRGNPVSQSRPPTTPARQIGHISTSETHPLGKRRLLLLKSQNPGWRGAAGRPPAAGVRRRRRCTAPQPPGGECAAGLTHAVRRGHPQLLRASQGRSRQAPVKIAAWWWLVAGGWWLGCGGCRACGRSLPSSLGCCAHGRRRRAPPRCHRRPRALLSLCITATRLLLQCC